MKRQNNRFLTPYQTMFAGVGFSGMQNLWWNDGHSYAMVPVENASEMTVLELLELVHKTATAAAVRVLLIGRIEQYPRWWFLTNGAGITWRLVSYNHESRTGVYEHSVDGRKVTLMRSENWVDGEQYPDVIEAYTAANNSFKRVFGFDFLGSPTMTGLYAAEQSLPQRLACPALPDDFAAYLHEQNTQGRTEQFLPAETRTFQYYDRIFAYAADARNDLPCGLPQWSEGGEFEPYRPAFYEVSFSPPKEWDHIGLLPTLGSDGWEWPRLTSFCEYVSLVAEPELRLAQAQGWKFRIRQSWKFEKGKPLENWRNRLVGLRDAALKDGQKAQANVFRKILLHAIGGMYARSFSRERLVDATELAEMNDNEALTAEPLNGGFRVEARIQRGHRFYMPHWTAYVWSYARVALAKKMLSIPFSELLGCNVDAIYSKSPIAAGTEVGAFRLKGFDTYTEPRIIRTKRDLIVLRTAAELAYREGGVEWR